MTKGLNIYAVQCFALNEILRNNMFIRIKNIKILLKPNLSAGATLNPTLEAEALRIYMPYQLSKNHINLIL